MIVRKSREQTADRFRLPVPGYSTEAESGRRLERLLGAEGSMESIGESVEGRRIHGYRWPATAGAPNPGLLLVSLIHPLEWIGRECLLDLLEHLLGGSDPLLPPGTPVFAVPNANPDGTARTEAALRTGRWGWFRGNASGIDLNRNFPRFHRTRGRWIDWWPMWRPGPYPLSEPESRALARWIEDKPIALSLSFHSFGRWFFYPPSASRAADTMTDRHREIVRQSLTRTPAPKYRESQLGRFSRLFRAYGTEIDFLQEQTGGLAYLVEISKGGFGRWGLRRLHHPFFFFNPPRPQREIAGLRPRLLRLISRSLLDDPGSSAVSDGG